jgi:hypothetical protein
MGGEDFEGKRREESRGEGGAHSSRYDTGTAHTAFNSENILQCSKKGPESEMQYKRQKLAERKEKRKRVEARRRSSFTYGCKLDNF